MNKSTLSKILIFTTGAAIGSFVSWILTKDYYEKIANDEIAEVKAHFAEMTAMKREVEHHQEISEEVKESPVSAWRDYKADISELSALASKYATETVKPYVITPDEFGDKYDEGYAEETLTYYADGVLTDDMDVVIDDVDGMVGLDSLNHFGEYEKDAVHVRNEKHKTDYEILRDNRTSDEVIGPLSPQDGE